VLPVVRGLEQEYGDRITFIRVNIHNPDNKAMLDHFGFSTAPELYLVDDQDRLLGAWGEGVTVAELKQAFEEVLNDNP
jgi:hypothetical protein